MRAPAGLPPRIRTDASNPFAHHTLAVRVPAILEEVLERNVDYVPRIRARIAALAAALRSGAALPALDASAPHAEQWLDVLATRREEGWLSSDWFTVENYAYRCLADASDFWRTGRDPFASIKLGDYRSAEHAQVLEAAVAIDGPPAERLERLLLAAVFGNRMDLSFAAARERGVGAEHADLLLDDRAAARQLLEARDGPVHLVLDNAGTELSVDLVLACRLLELLDATVVLHVKVHPCFVSDTIAADLDWFLDASEPEAAALWSARTAEARRCREQLARARQGGRLRIAAHAFWSGPHSLWECPP
ncbi:MAG TPA: ARMT1-like domain-containing protein, partial [Polyangiaceae bacterium]|nr:ARMT1-like domain-containing protein [Polyangiaceae bacterium]